MIQPRACGPWGANVVSMPSGTIYRSEFRRHNFLRRLNFHAGYRNGGSRGKTITPHGPVPTGIVAATVLSARFTTEMLFDGPLAESRVFASGERAMPHGRLPTVTEARTV